MRNLLDTLENLRNKPEPVRRIIAGVIVVVLMAAILSVWSLTFSLDLRQGAQIQTASASDFSSPLSILWNFAKDSVGSLLK